MSAERDVGLVGTGIAPLIAAQILMRRGWSVLVLNPENDFFLENSEMGFDPLKQPHLERLGLQRLDRAREILEPEFPGAIESWSRERGTEYFDLRAPFLRSRNWNWFGIEDRDGCLLQFEAQGWHPQASDGITALRKIPGYTPTSSQEARESAAMAVGLSKMADIDVDRYRNGVLEFVRSRLDPQDLVAPAGSIEPTAEGVRFYQSGSPRTVRLKHGLRVFRTPRLGAWLQSLGVEGALDWTTWEEWTLISRDPLDPSQLGYVGGATIYARVEGVPRGPIHELSVLTSVGPGEKPISHASFDRLGSVVQRVLNWDRFSVRDLKERKVIAGHPGSTLRGSIKNLHWMAGVDGALVQIVHGVQQEIQEFCRRVEA